MKGSHIISCRIFSCGRSSQLIVDTSVRMCITSTRIKGASSDSRESSSRDYASCPRTHKAYRSHSPDVRAVLFLQHLWWAEHIPGLSVCDDFSFAVGTPLSKTCYCAHPIDILHVVLSRRPTLERIYFSQTRDTRKASSTCHCVPSLMLRATRIKMLELFSSSLCLSFKGMPGQSSKALLIILDLFSWYASQKRRIIPPRPSQVMQRRVSTFPECPTRNVFPVPRPTIFFVSCLYSNFSSILKMMCT